MDRSSPSRPTQGERRDDSLSVDGEASDELDEATRIRQGRPVAEADELRLEGGHPPGRAAILGRNGREQTWGLAEAPEPGGRAEVGEDIAEDEHAVLLAPV